MFRVSCRGPRAGIEAAWDALAWADPSPAGAVDAREAGRRGWILDAYAETEADAEACAAMIVEAAPELAPGMEKLASRDWVQVSLEGLPAVEAGPFIVAGDHALAATSPGRTAILIEAGPAFGTGHHGTTLGCLMALEKVMRRQRPGRVLDIGTGSGVLAIAALKAGAGRAIGTDTDPDSVRAATENAGRNHVGRRFKSLLASGVRASIVRGSAPYDLVFANILARPLVRLAPDIVKVTAPGGAVILSGLLTHQEPQVRAAFAGRGLVLTDRIRRDGWSTLVFTRKQRRQLTGPQRLARRAQRVSRRTSRRGRPSSGAAIASFVV